MSERPRPRSPTVPIKPSEHLGPGWIHVRGPHHDQITDWAGKWLLYLPRERVADSWATIAAATTAGRLGVAAKVV